MLLVLLIISLAAERATAQGGNYVTMKFYSAPNDNCAGTATVEAQWQTSTCYQLSSFVSPTYPILSAAAANFATDVSCNAATVTANYYYQPGGADCSATPIQTVTGQTDAVAYCASFSYEAPALGVTYNFGAFSYRCSLLPCFSREVSTACRVTGTTSPLSAYEQCFGEAAETSASRVLMTELIAGDHVLTVDAFGELTTTRLIVNQHVKPNGVMAELLTIKHANGTLELTPDHVLSVNGEFSSARSITPGATLAMPDADGRMTTLAVEAVTKKTGGIVNPVTVSGTLLAAADGAPVLASAYPEWIATYALGFNFYPLPFSLSSMLSYLFPHSTQAFYEAHLEALFWKHANFLQQAENVAPCTAKTLIIAAIDGAAFGAFALTQAAHAPVVTLAALAAAVALRARK